MNFAVIAISGKAEAGKTACAKILQNIINTYPGYKGEIRPFAAQLKKIAKEVFFWDECKDLIYKETVSFGVDGTSQQKELVQDQGRQLLVNIGAMGRAIRPTVWSDYVCKSILKEIEDGTAFGKVYIIDDLRYTNELKVLRNFGAKLTLVRVFRDKQLNLDIESEKDLDNYTDWEYKIDNNGDLEDLAKSLELVASSAIKNAYKDA